MNKFKVYLGGKMGGLTFNEMNDWRVKATTLLKNESDNKIHTINPVAYYNFEMDRSGYTDKEVMKFDLHQVRGSDLILVDLSHPESIGTAIELYEASEISHIPVIGFSKAVTLHPWMELCCDKICDRLEDAVDYILDYYLPNF